VFGGVTRRVGKEVSPSYDYRLVPYKTQYVVTVNWLAYTAFVGSTITPAPPHTYYVPINNYDVELYSLQIIDTIGYPYSSAKVQLYNAARVALSNVPVVALYLSDPVPYGRNSSDRPSIGAFVPPLVFPKETNIQLDVYSLLTPANGTQTLTFVFEGMQRIPK
jgi:hypothetical protein